MFLRKYKNECKHAKSVRVIGEIGLSINGILGLATILCLVIICLAGRSALVDNIAVVLCVAYVLSFPLLGVTCVVAGSYLMLSPTHSKCAR